MALDHLRFGLGGRSLPVAVGLDCGGGGGALPADDRFLKPTFRDRQTALSSDHLVEEMQILADRLQTSCAVEEDGAGAEDAEAEADFSGPDGVPPSSAAAVLSYPPPPAENCHFIRRPVSGPLQSCNAIIIFFCGARPHVLLASKARIAHPPPHPLTSQAGHWSRPRPPPLAALVGGTQTPSRCCPAPVPCRSRGGAAAPSRPGPPSRSTTEHD